MTERAIVSMAAVRAKGSRDALRILSPGDTTGLVAIASRPSKLSASSDNWPVRDNPGVG